MNVTPGNRVEKTCANQAIIVIHGHNFTRLSNLESLLGQHDADVEDGVGRVLLVPVPRVARAQTEGPELGPQVCQEGTLALVTDDPGEVVEGLHAVLGQLRGEGPVQVDLRVSTDTHEITLGQL